ncbi:hypothetical protein EDD86DRAFT_250345 [Gorgonomyces haynaldii]|nr:hypothetical protein EDD86DRAFT_250345 [Gorgonomyces haynaldii]
MYIATLSLLSLTYAKTLIITGGKPQGQGQVVQNVPQQSVPGQQAVPGTDRPSNVPICDFYTQKIFGQNNAENQLKLLTKLVNTVVIGNYTAGTTVPGVVGILAPVVVNGERVDLSGFFNGQLQTTNVGGVASKVNFLDGGGADPLKLDQPANNQNSNQFRLLTHLYSFFGGAIGCSDKQFPPYTGNPSMLETHRFMNLNANQLAFFTQQLGLAAKSFGVADGDIAIVANVMNTVFNVRCAQPSSPFPPLAGIQSFCLGTGCPLAQNPDPACAQTQVNTLPAPQGQITPSQPQQTNTGSDRPSNVPICDFYTQKIFGQNNAQNQVKLLTKLVNTVVIGNYTAGTTVPGVVGILAPVVVNGERVDLSGFFNGQLQTTNVGGVASKVNFLDGGGADPLKLDQPANNQNSNQFRLLTHLYSFFGGAIGCSDKQFPPYTGNPSMLETHKFMNLNINQLSFFTQQLGLAAKSFGVADADIAIIANVMNTVFNVKCAKPSSPFPPLSGVQSFCLGNGCPLAQDPDQVCVQTGAVGGGVGNNPITNGQTPGTATPIKCRPRKI